MFKIFEINSIRSRMVTGFLFLTCLILILAVVSLSSIDRITQIARMHSSISQLEIYTLSLIKCDNDFFDLETINEDYFNTRTSSFLNRRDSLNKLIAVKITGLITEEEANNYGVKESLIAIDTTLLQYNSKFKKLEELVFKKGFKDYGVEGTMRFHAHAMEELVEGNDILYLLYLRRHEKDFLLRNDTAYLRSFRDRSVLLRTHLKNKKAMAHLNEYEKLFHELSEIQSQLGLTSKHGLRNELNNLTYSLSDQYYALSEYSYVQSERTYNNVRIFYVMLLSGAIIFSILSGYWISKRLSAPIARLSRVMQSAISSGNASKTDLRIQNAAIEISTLANSFIQLMNQVNSQIDRIKVKSKLLRQKNKELKKLNHELDNFLYSTAHDLRSPLSSLLGLINLMRHENKQQELVQYIDMMEKSLNRSESFISQIVSFSKNKRLEMIPEKLDLHALISNIFDDHRFIEGSVLIKKVITINGTAPFYSDRNRLTIIFNNLVSNAIKYADLKKDEPFIRITVDINPLEAVIEFSDNGVGIENKHVKSIFKMFYRAHLNSKGSGLGLFIFKETIASMKGHATVESEVGHGTKFFIRLPNQYQHSEMRQELQLNVQ